MATRSPNGFTRCVECKEVKPIEQISRYTKGRTCIDCISKLRLHAGNTGTTSHGHKETRHPGFETTAMRLGRLAQEKG